MIEAILNSKKQAYNDIVGNQNQKERFTKELIDKAKECKTAEEILALAKENGYELSLEEAGLFLHDFEEGELTDEELDNVAGGAEGCSKRYAYEQVFFPTEAAVQYIFNIGDIMQEFVSGVGHHTSTVKIIGRKAERWPDRDDQWWDEYNTERISGFGAAEWADRSRFEKK